MKPTKEHLEKINGRLAGYTLKEDAVEVLPFLVFNTKQTDRYTIMSREMLAKMAADLNAGTVAFNKLHQSQSALPVGSSISGRVIETAEGADLQAMMYAVTKRPDGTVFEDGKDLADRYVTGAVRACSAGVQVGFYKCNICGNDIRDWENCEHIPGQTYKKDEQPHTCLALMTGHKIVDGVAQDCGIYEVSAVTAGGVAAAGSMTEAFGAYEEGADVTDFKKSVSDGKQLSSRIEFSTDPIQDETLFSQEEDSMEKQEVENMLKAHYDPLTQEIASLKEQAIKDKEAYTSLETTSQEKLVQADAQILEGSTALETLQAEYDQLKDLAEFKEAYIASVSELAVKAGAELKEEKTLEEYKALVEGYKAELAKLPSGQVLEGGEPTEAVASINPNFYKI